MPLTRYTTFCNQGFDLVSRMGKLAVGQVMPAMEKLRDADNREAKRDVAIFCAYLPIVAWLQTFENLNHTYDFQAVGGGARAIFESYTDLKWFEKFNAPEWIERYLNFPLVNKYQAAAKAIKHSSTPGSRLDAEIHKEFIRAADAKEPVETLVKRVWGTTSSGKSKWPGSHWTGFSKLPDRAGQVSVQLLDTYRHLYPPLSWLVHSGPTAHWGCDFEDLEAKVGWCYLYSAQIAREATVVAVSLLGIEQKLVGFKSLINQLRAWEVEAVQTIPIADAK